MRTGRKLLVISERFPDEGGTEFLSLFLLSVAQIVDRLLDR